MVQGTGRHLISEKKGPWQVNWHSDPFPKSLFRPSYSQDSLWPEPGLFRLQKVNNQTERDQHFAEDNYTLAQRGDCSSPLKWTLCSWASSLRSTASKHCGIHRVSCQPRVVGWAEKSQGTSSGWSTSQLFITLMGRDASLVLLCWMTPDADTTTKPLMLSWAKVARLLRCFWCSSAGRLET